MSTTFTLYDGGMTSLVPRFRMGHLSTFGCLRPFLAAVFISTEFSTMARRPPFWVCRLHRSSCRIRRLLAADNIATLTGLAASLAEKPVGAGRHQNQIHRNSPHTAIVTPVHSPTLPLTTICDPSHIYFLALTECWSSPNHGWESHVVA